MGFIQRFLFENENIRGEFIHLENSYQTILQQHDYPEAIQTLLGQTLMTSALLAETMKFDGQLTLQLQCDGPVNLLVAKCNHQRHIRGLAKWQDNVEPLNLQSTLGEGNLVITLEYDKKIKPYQSIIPLEEKSIAQAVADYYLRSEQLATQFVLACDQSTAAGLMLQVMPGEFDQNIWNEVTLLANTLTKSELLGLGAKTILKRLYHEHDIRLYDPAPVEFRCTCSEARMERAIVTLGQHEANDILKEKASIVVTCEFCNNEFAFGREQVDDIFTRRAAANDGSSDLSG